MKRTVVPLLFFLVFAVRPCFAQSSESGRFTGTYTHTATGQEGEAALDMQYTPSEAGPPPPGPSLPGPTGMIAGQANFMPLANGGYCIAGEVTGIMTVFPEGGAFLVFDIDRSGISGCTPNVFVNATLSADGNSISGRYYERRPDLTGVIGEIHLVRECVEPEGDEIDFETLLESCPFREQKDKLHEVDGCSAPSFLQAFIDRQDPAASDLAREPTAFGEEQGMVTANDIRPLPCNQHDLCYQSCASDQNTCDNGFHQAMLNVCFRAFPMPCPLTDSNECGRYLQDRDNCFESANYYAAGVDNFGRDAFKDRQLQYCECCPSIEMSGR